MAVTAGYKASEFFAGVIQNLYPIPVDQSAKTSIYKDMARRLSRLARKNPAWGWKYIESVLHGSVQPSRRLMRACEQLAASLDGSDGRIIGMQAVQVYADPGSVAANALVLSPSRACAHPTCRINFIPVVYNQQYCPAHARKR